MIVFDANAPFPDDGSGHLYLWSINGETGRWELRIDAAPGGGSYTYYFVIDDIDPPAPNTP